MAVVKPRSVPIVKALLRGGASFRQADCFGGLLGVAVKNNDVAIAELLIAAGADPAGGTHLNSALMAMMGGPAGGARISHARSARMKGYEAMANMLEASALKQGKTIVYVG